jgi:large subunit ribosomal protein L17
MRHLNAFKRMSRGPAHRIATLRNMATALFTQERITTTEIKAKTLRPWAEKLITLAKRGDLHARRIAAADIHDHATLQKLFGELAERFRTRPGGYTRIMKLGQRRGDNGSEAIIELVDAKPPQARVAEPVPAKTEKPAAKAKAPKAPEVEADEAEEADEADEKAEKKKAPAKKAPKAKAEKKPAKAKAEKKASKAKAEKSSGKKKSK